LTEWIEPDVDRGQSAQGPLGIHFLKVSPFSRQIILGKHGLNRAFRHARVTVDAGLGVDDQHIVVKVKSLDGTRDGTISITTIDARLGNYVSHPLDPPGVMQLLRG
jgi:hypothetical protein